MPNRTFSTLMASAAIFGSALVGCSGSEHLQVKEANAASLAPGVEQALASRDYGRALIQAERLVTAQPRDGAARALRGRAYLANGRYTSARTAFNDAMTLGNRDARTIVSLALCQTALGNATEARVLLAAHVQDLPAGDYGLAMAMAGDPQEGVRALLQATEQPDATARTRQNLAYALAMAGAWGQARLVAGQDLPPREAEARIAQWAQAVGAGDERSRVIAMIGVAPRSDDSGMPTRLALENSTPESAAPVQLASVGDLISDARHHAEAVASTAGNEAGAAAASAAANPATSGSDTAALAAAFRQNDAAASPEVKPVTEPTRRAMQAAFAREAAPHEAMPAPRAAMNRFVINIAAPVPDAQASDWVVQLGAYDSEAVAQEKWRRITVRRAVLKDFQPVRSTVAFNGRTFHRLAIRGFANVGTAQTTCSALKAMGQACFVRLDDSGATRSARADASRKGELAGAKAKGTVALASR